MCPELWRKPIHVVREECCLVAGAGEGGIAKAGVEQVRVDAGICMDEEAPIFLSQGQVIASVYKSDPTKS